MSNQQQPNDDAQKLHQERMQKLNSVMGHLGYKNNNNNNNNTSNNKQIDESSLLSAKDVAALRKNMLHLQPSQQQHQQQQNLFSSFSSTLSHTQPEDSYIFAILRWCMRSVKASVEAGLYHTQQAHESYKLSQAEKKKQQELLAARRKKEEQDRLHQQRLKHQADMHAKRVEEEQRRKKAEGGDLGASAEGRTLKINLSEEDLKDIHPKVGMIRDEIMDLEKKAHDTLDRVLKARLRFLTLSQEDPPCTPEMRSVADCYAQFAAKKYETAVHLEKENATPDVVKRHQLQNPEQGGESTTTTTSEKKSASSSSFSSWWKSGSKKNSATTTASKFSSREQPDLPKELLATEEVLKLSTSVLACRELAKKLETCALDAGLKHVEKNHGEM